MSKIVPLLLTFTLSLALAVGPLAAGDSTKRPELITGEVVSLWNYMARGQHGEDERGYSVRLVEKGLPVREGGRQ